MFLIGQGQPVRAAGYFQRASDTYLRVLGADYPLTKTVRGNLATVRQHR